GASILEGRRRRSSLQKCGQSFSTDSIAASTLAVSTSPSSPSGDRSPRSAGRLAPALAGRPAGPLDGESLVGGEGALGPAPRGFLTRLRVCSAGSSARHDKWTARLRRLRDGWQASAWTAGGFVYPTKRW